MVQTNTLPTKFNLIREGCEYFLLLPQPRQYKLNRYRFRHHGRNKWDYRMEPVAGTDVKRQPISEEDAQALANDAFKQGRILDFFRRDTEDGEKWWDMCIQAAM